MQAQQILLEYLQREEDLGAFTESELLDFLRDHELFEVVDPIQFDARDLQEADLNGAGLRLVPHVILTTRVPTERQMAEQMSRLIADRVQKNRRQFEELLAADEAGARQALIDAAATAARYASGAASRDQAVAALNEALTRIRVLAGPAPTSRAPTPEGALSRSFLALVLAGANDRRGVRPDLGAAP